ncbi:hypothetical protein Cgig2_011374 [Carnegiea gigantea]|uniref:Uncharacterized protein n=1 Tax=Carnegiea gigantea TaxID=171969 RepID=A0A9Q1QN12_9CARY|nr:hypothetical protein Cgig2_011374 [Carnegiea gigantea]
MMAITLLARHVPNSFTSSDVHGERKCKYTGQSVRAIPMRVITVGKKRDRGIQLIVDEYTEKIRHYCTMDDVLIRSNPKNARDAKAQIEHEDIAVTNLISRQNDDHIVETLAESHRYRTSLQVVILDERGKDVSSEQLADLIGDARFTVGLYRTVSEYRDDLYCSSC